MIKWLIVLGIVVTGCASVEPVVEPVKVEVQVEKPVEVRQPVYTTVCLTNRDRQGNIIFDNTGKASQTCTKVRVRGKFEGTPIPKQ